MGRSGAQEYDDAVSLASRFDRSAARHGLLRAGGAVVVACSGGGDSVALALLLHARAAAAGTRVVLAHLDHGLRTGSADDAAFVAALAERLGCAHRSSRRMPVTAPGESPEAAARVVRYRFLRDVAEDEDATAVATAHTADDQAETLLMRAFRGSSAAGLAGIPPRRRLTASCDVVRPLLFARRAELREWLRSRGEPWREDPTNQGGNVRARVRDVVLPAAARATLRDPVPGLARTAENVRAARGLVDVARLAEAFVEHGSDGVALHVGAGRLPFDALAMVVGRAVEGRLTPGRTVSRAAARRITRSLLDAEVVDVEGGLRVIRGPSGARVVVREPAAREARPEAPVPLPLVAGEAVRPEGVSHGVRSERLPVVEGLLARLRNSRSGLLDAGAVQGAVCVRGIRVDDRVAPIGQAAPRRVTTLLRRLALRPGQARALPLVTDDVGPLWAPGAFTASRAQVRPATTTTLLLVPVRHPNA